MKKSILVITVLILLSMASYSQSDFTVDNQTDCDVDVVITPWTTNCGDCTSQRSSTGGTAFANTQTRITNGGPNAWEWGKIEITIGGGGSSVDGITPCASASGSIICNAEDIYVVWLDCSNAEIKKQ